MFSCRLVRSPLDVHQTQLTDGAVLFNCVPSDILPAGLCVVRGVLNNSGFTFLSLEFYWFSRLVFSCSRHRLFRDFYVILEN